MAKIIEDILDFLRACLFLCFLFSNSMWNNLTSFFSNAITLIRRFSQKASKWLRSLFVLFILLMFSAHSAHAQTFKEFDKTMIKDLSRQKLEAVTDSMIERGRILEDNNEKILIALDESNRVANEYRTKYEISNRRFIITVSLAVGIGVGAGLCYMFSSRR